MNFLLASRGLKMKKNSVKRHLSPYSIFKKRATTINHAFASALAEFEEYEEYRVVDAIRTLGQDPNAHLLCVYCDKPAETWDHVFGLVKATEYSGYGHVLGNLVPCCKACNSKKGNKNWKEFLRRKPDKIEILESFFEKFLSNKFNQRDISSLFPEKIQKYTEVKNEIFRLMKEADIIAESIRDKIKERKRKMSI